ncbi:MAG: exonuclease domain-containing protein, partial [Bacteroidales bacterium]
ILKVFPNENTEIRTYRVNPEMHIPESSSLIHGIYDADVAKEPVFKEIAPQLIQFIANGDLAGFNSNRFDIPLLMEEFLRVDMDFDLKGRRFIDVQNIFHKMEKRTLAAASLFYLNKPLEGAHGAKADTVATYEVLKAQVQKYAGVPYFDKLGKESLSIKNDIPVLAEFSTMNKTADFAGFIGYDEQGEEIFNFGKYKGQTVEKIFKMEPSYYDWMQKSDFPRYTKKILTEIRLRGLGS